MCHLIKNENGEFVCMTRRPFKGELLFGMCEYVDYNGKYLYGFRDFKHFMWAKQIEKLALEDVASIHPHTILKTRKE